MSQSQQYGFDKNKAVVVIGAQFGDEGKGKLVDLLAENARYVCRFNGGSNAGHTIKANGHTYKLNMIPSGIVHPRTKNIIGNGVVIHLPDFFAEIDRLEQAGIECEDRIFVSNRAHLLFDAHRKIDGL
jgi:adenylosuccinate synthase